MTTVLRSMSWLYWYSVLYKKGGRNNIRVSKYPARLISLLVIEKIVYESCVYAKDAPVLFMTNNLRAFMLIAVFFEHNK